MKDYTVKIGDGNIAVDDMILVKDVEAHAGSKMLEGFKPLFSAEAVCRLEKNGYKISGKTAVGEFGLDLAGEFSYDGDGEVKGAAAELIKNGEIKAALGVDQNGAPRRAAALSSVSFLKPTYGTVSRYGVISCAASGEVLGVYGKGANEISEVMSIIAGHDEKDGTSLKNEKYDYTVSEDVKGKKVALIKELYEKADSETRSRIDAFAASLKAAGAEVSEISANFFETASAAWQILMTAEICNNISRYDGVKFGHRAANYKDIDELYVNSRTEGFNFLTKAVILYGSDALSKNRYEECYDKSLKVRRVIAQKFESLMKDYDALLLPVCSKTSYEKYDIKDAFMKVFEESLFTSLPNLIGTPALSCGGVQLLGRHFGESTLLSLANCAEKEGK